LSESRRFTADLRADSISGRIIRRV